MNRPSRTVIISLITLCIGAIGLVLFLGLSGQGFCGVRTNDFMGMLSIGFGLGCMPFIPGTAGALAGVILSLYLCRLHVWKQLVAVSVMIILAIPISEYGERHFASKDPSSIVIDELLTFPLATIGLPIHQHPILLAGVFMTNRIVDWTKPPPARAAESIPRGVGIVLDDVVASLWALLIFSIGWRWYRRQ